MDGELMAIKTKHNGKKNGETMLSCAELVGGLWLDAGIAQESFVNRSLPNQTMVFNIDIGVSYTQHTSDEINDAGKIKFWTKTFCDWPNIR